jgi:hypothetical protein
LIFSTTSSMFQNILNIPLALLAIKVIKDYAKVEPILFDLKEEEEVQVEVQAEVQAENQEEKLIEE